MDNHIISELTNLEQLAKVRLERIRELEDMIAKCKAVTKYLRLTVDLLDSSTLHLLEARIADFTRRRDTLLAQPLGDAHDD